MSAKKMSKRFMLYIGLFLVSLFLIFFVGTKVDKESGSSYHILTSQGLLHFKKGLDIAGGVRLTYKIDFSKYESTYVNETELLQAKKTAQDIILKNIDSRISKLGVSDYAAYIQRLTDGDYLVVEIGWLSDIDEAKGIIGKTVELEFKLANTQNQGSPEQYAARQQIAENLLVAVSANPEQFESIGTGKGSDDIFYSHYTDTPLEQLPDIYATNFSFLQSLQTGKVYPRLLTDVYHVVEAQDASGAVQSQTLQWFTMVKFNGATSMKLDTIDPSRVITVAKARGYDPEIIWTKDVQSSATGMMVYKGPTLTYVWPEALPGVTGYDIALYQVVDFPNAATILDTIKSWKEPSTEQAQKMVDGWADGGVLDAQLVGFEPGESIKLYDQAEGIFILKIRNSKGADQTLVPTVPFTNLNQQAAQSLVAAMENAEMYDIEDIRVQDTQTWITAQDPKTNDILNGAFFKFANVSQSQTGKPVVAINFDDKGKDVFCNITADNIGRQMAIFVGGQLMTAPTIQDKICGGTAQIDGTFDIKSAKELTENLNSGALPAPLLLAHEEKVSPTLWESALKGAFLAIGIGFVVIFALMLFMYGWKRATIVAITLIFFLVFLMAIFKLFGVVASLSAIAAAVLTIGMAVDANVLIFERLNEELAQGKSMRTAIHDAYDRSWFPIRDGNISTGLIGFLLFTMGVNVFKWFGTTILINMILILLVNVPLTKELLLLFYVDKK